jgi:glycosyltransferase involved in cell wall biosynthesis
VKALVVHPDFATGSGGAQVAAWMLQAVANQGRAALLAWERPDFARVDSFYGTSLEASGVEVVLPPRWLRAAVDVGAAVDGDPWSIQPWAALMRLARRASPGFDAVLSANNEADLGPKALQYIHYPYLHRRLARAGRLGRLRPWRLLSGFDVERMRRQRTLVNSDWSAGVVRDLYGIEPVTVYPPARGGFPDVPWDERADAFVCVGRIAEEKRFELAVEIVERVRARRPGVRLDIAGFRPPAACGTEYLAKVRRLAAERPWVTLHEDMPGPELARLVAGRRYGLHAMREEHYGIAVAEMVRAGCVVFTPRGGGQVEITRDERLAYDTAGEAAAKILAVMDGAAVRDALRAHLAARAHLLSAERFAERIADMVRGGGSAGAGRARAACS